MTNTPYPETLVNTTTSGSQTVAATLALDDGGWVVVWSSDGQDGDGNGLYQQAFNADGTARGDETRINTYTTDDQYFRSVTALADGGWLVTMESVGQDGDDRGIYQQRFDANSGSIDEGDRVVLSFLVEGPRAQSSRRPRPRSLDHQRDRHHDRAQEDRRGRSRPGRFPVLSRPRRPSRPPRRPPPIPISWEYP